MDNPFTSFNCDVSVIETTGEELEAWVDSWLPMRLRVTIGHGRLAQLESLLVNKIERGDKDAIQYLERERARLVNKLMRQALRSAARQFDRRRRQLDIGLTMLFALSLLLHLWSVPAGATVEISLVAALYMVDHVFRGWADKFKKVATNPYSQICSALQTHGAN